MTTVDSIPVWNYLLIGVFNIIQSLTSTLQLRDHLIVCQLFELITIQRTAGGFSHFTAILCIIHIHYHYICQGRRKHFFGGQAKNIMETNGALARHKICKFNYIHDYDVIIIGHERSSKVLSLLTSA